MPPLKYISKFRCAISISFLGFLIEGGSCVCLEGPPGLLIGGGRCVCLEGSPGLLIGEGRCVSSGC